jgi:hypothetical protein
MATTGEVKNRKGATGSTAGKVKPDGNGKEAALPARGPGAPAAAAAQRSFCSLPQVPERVFGPNVFGARLAAIRVIEKTWVNGTVLKYYFFSNKAGGSPDASWVGNKANEDVVRKAFNTWKDLGIGLEFQEVSAREDAQVRIGFMRGDGAWSYVGRDILEQGVNERTMNFGWDLTGADGFDTALHEIGHTLGFPHEHQNPNAGIVWNEEAVYDELAAPPNEWPRETTYYNIIRKLPAGEVKGSNWDPNSVMHYPFGPGLIKEPATYAGGLYPAGGLSAEDKRWVRQFYPPMTNAPLPRLQPTLSQALKLSPGQQADFEIVPEVTKHYRLGTFGTSDTLLVLFEDEGGALRYRAGDDDSGEESNAQIRIKLVRNRRYVLRVRLFYKEAGGDTSIMMW